VSDFFETLIVADIVSDLFSTRLRRILPFGLILLLVAAGLFACWANGYFD